MDASDLEPQVLTEEELDALVASARDDHDRRVLVELRTYRRLVPHLLDWCTAELPEAALESAPLAVMRDLLRRRPPIAFITRDIVAIEGRVGVIHPRLRDLSSTGRYHVHCVKPEGDHLDDTATVIPVAMKSEGKIVRELAHALWFTTLGRDDLPPGTLVYTDAVTIRR